MSPEKDEQMRRSTDSNASVRIVREVPLWGIISALVFIAGQGVNQYYGQKRLEEVVTAGAQETKELKGIIEALRAGLSSQDLKYAQHEIQIKALERQLDALQAVVKRRE